MSICEIPGKQRTPRGAGSLGFYPLLEGCFVKATFSEGGSLLDNF